MIPTFDLGQFAFGAPLALLGLAVLPVIIWLLRLTPPTPRRQTFPPLRLLQGLRERAQHSARTPPWLIVLRMTAVACAVLGLAQPLIAPRVSALQRAPLLVVIDDDWAATPDWPRRQTLALSLLADAATAQRPAALLTSTLGEDGAAPSLTPFRLATDARRTVQALTPKPWPPDYAATLSALKKTLAEAQITTPIEVVWFADGLQAPGQSELTAHLQHLGGLTVITPDGPPQSLGHPLVLDHPERTADGLRLTVRWTSPSNQKISPSSSLSPQILPPMVSLRATDDQGRTIATVPLSGLPSPQPTIKDLSQAQVLLPLPADALRTVARIEIILPDGRPAGAGGVHILDDRWRQRPVGLVHWAQGTSGNQGIPLLSAETYLRTALGADHDLREGSLTDIMAQPIGTVFLPDSPQAASLAPDQIETLGQWVEKGGVLVRFAGPYLAAARSSRLGTAALLPVPLRQGGRTLGGVLSWNTPATLSTLNAQGPFGDLTIPPGVTVASQVLADPASLANAEVWARLSDGTPLVSAARKGEGWLVLVHTSADPSWSTLAYSGLYPALLTRLVALGDGPQPNRFSAAQANRSTPPPEGHEPLTFPPLRSLNGFGYWQSPPASAQALDLLGSSLPMVSALHPPGLYGHLVGGAGASPLPSTGFQRIALNLSETIRTLHPVVDWPPGVLIRTQIEDHGPLDLRPPLLLFALALLWCDGIIALWLRGLLGRPQRPIRRPGPPSSSLSSLFFLGAVVATVLGTAGGGTARTAFAQAPVPSSIPTSPKAIETLLEGRLAYVLTGDPSRDALSHAALGELTTLLRNRTSIELAPPVGISPGQDDLTFFPLIYWPAQSQTPPVDRATQVRLESYRDHGGMILFDAAAQADGSPAVDALRVTLQAVGIQRLQPMPTDHLLTRTFYLTPGLPGRLAEGQVWIEPQAVATPGGNEQAVSTVIATTQDWAGAWATDDRGRPLLPLLGGGTRGREMAYRGGINMVVYALTGTYKADQVHVPAILERLEGPLQPPIYQEGPLNLIPPSLSPPTQGDGR